MPLISFSRTQPLEYERRRMLIIGMLGWDWAKTWVRSPAFNTRVRLLLTNDELIWRLGEFAEHAHDIKKVGEIENVFGKE
jgi:hypothetical protein